MPTNQVETLSLDSIEQYRMWLCDRGRSPHTAKSYSSDLKQLLLWASTDSIALSGVEDMGAKWLTAHNKELGAKTTGRRLTSLRGFARWAGAGAILLDYTAPTPLKAMPHPLAEGMGGVNKMIAKAENEPLRVVVALCGLAGLRISEALDLPPGDIDFANKRIKVNGKGNKWRVVPMNAKLADILMVPTMKALMEERPLLISMGDRLARRSITRLGKRAGIKQPVASHQLRATFATHLHANGTPLRVVQEILGHSSSKTTEVYTGVSDKQMHDAVENL
jgi:site-specific recombinase XerD